MQVRIPGLEILGELAQGYDRAVYKVRHPKLNRLCALKTEYQHAMDFTSRPLMTEARSLAAVQHPNIVQVLEVSEWDRGLYILMEFAEGGDLVRRTGNVWPPKHAAELVEKLARAIHAVHEAGLVHRDLHASHVLLMADGTPKLTGLSRAAPIGQPSESDFGLGHRYMSPERALGMADCLTPAHDIHALGTILYQLLTGRSPLKGRGFEALIHLAESSPTRPRDLCANIPEDLEAICLVCLRKEPSERYASAAWLAADLRQFLAGYFESDR